MRREVVVCGAPFADSRVREYLRQMKEDGVTAVQIYMHWNKFETGRRGGFDFSVYDGQVALLKEAGLKFVPFLIMGPRYAAPAWWLKDGNFVPLRCLEHGKDCPIDSIWNPAFRAEVERVMEVFAAHYLPMDVVESVQPGICGDYGEAIMPAHGNWPNAYHTHRGMWCGGEDARHSFREWLTEKYGKIAALNAAWRSHHESFAQAEPFLAHKAPSRTAWFDLIQWYHGSMTEYMEFWMKTARKYFPDTPIYMCTGGREEPQNGALFSDQAKAAAKYGGGLRLTNEKNDFFSNFFDCNAYTHDACGLYGAYLGLEPVGPMTKEGIGSRILGSAFYGNRQIFFYYANIYPGNDMDGEKAALFRKYISLVQERKTQNRVAVLWPKYVGIMEGGVPERIRETSKFIRQRTDYRFVNENMIADGVLEKAELLIIPCAVFTDVETVRAICAWVEKGGVLFHIGEVTGLELEPVPEFDRMIGFTEETDFCEGHAAYDIPQDVPFPGFAARKRYFSEVGYSNLAEDVTPLGENKGKVFTEYIGIEMQPVYSAFTRKHGKGTVISYFGPTNLLNDMQELHPDCCLAELIDDVLKGYARDLRIAEGEVVRGLLDGEVYALLPDGSIKKVI